MLSFIFHSAGEIISALNSTDVLYTFQYRFEACMFGTLWGQMFD